MMRMMAAGDGEDEQDDQNDQEQRHRGLLTLYAGLGSDVGHGVVTAKGKSFGSTAHGLVVVPSSMQYRHRNSNPVQSPFSLDSQFHPEPE